jgi:NodT family efflux transporter outer membrane factor (OMF) lipoprotein
MRPTYPAILTTDLRTADLPMASTRARSFLSSTPSLPLWASVAVLLAVFCSSCAQTVRYVRPAVQAPTGFREIEGADQWRTATPGDGIMKGKWWEIFGDPQLNALEEKVSIDNYSVKQFEAIFRQSIAIIDTNRSGYYPTVTTSPSITQSDRGANAGGGRGPSATFSLPFTATWVPDLWNRVGLSVDNANFAAQLSAANLENLRLSLQATLAIEYYSILSLDMQIALLNDSIAAYETYLELTNNRFNGGVASKADVYLAQTQLYTTQAQATDLAVTRDQFEHALAVVIGQAPANFRLPVGKIDTVPPPIPVGVPSALLERRPDIAAQERLVMAANTTIGISKTAWYPTLTLSGSVALTSGSLLNLLSWGSRVWTAGPVLAQTLFDAGRRRSILRQSEAAYDATAATYQETVLNAFQQVEDNLSTLRVLAEESATQALAVDAAEQSLTLETERYKAGTDTYLNVILTQTIALNNERTAVTLLQRRMVAAVNLILALGGGWDSSALPTPEQMKSPDMYDPAKTVNIAQPVQ